MESEYVNEILDVKDDVIEVAEKKAREKKEIEPVTKENTRKNQRFLVGALILGFLFNVLFFEKSLGISYLLFIVGFYAFFLWEVQKQITFKWNFGWFLTIPVVLLSSTYLFFSNEIFMVLNFIIIPVLLMTQVLVLTNRNCYSWFTLSFLPELFVSFILLPLEHFFTAFRVKYSIPTDKQNTTWKVTKKILIGLLISIPVLLVVLSLLASADIIFNQFIGDFMTWLQNLNTWELVEQIFLIFIVSMIMFSIFWGVTKKRKSFQQKETSNSLPFTFDSTICITVLSLISCVYLIFVVIQFAYLFGGLTYSLPEGYTYAEYAREGFSQLVWVTILNLVILLLVTVFQSRKNTPSKRVIQSLNSLLVVFTVVILVSAFFRMSLYEAAYGYTYLRILTHSFMIYLAVLLLFVLWKIWKEKVPFTQIFVIITIICYLGVNFIGIDSMIVRKNLDRYVATNEIDIEYLQTLSYESVPVLFAKAKEISANGVKLNINMDYYLEEYESMLWVEEKWPSFNVPKYRALKTYERLFPLKKAKVEAEKKAFEEPSYEDETIEDDQ